MTPPLTQPEPPPSVQAPLHTTPALPPPTTTPTATPTPRRAGTSQAAMTDLLHCVRDVRCSAAAERHLRGQRRPSRGSGPGLSELWLTAL